MNKLLVLTALTLLFAACTPESEPDASQPPISAPRSPTPGPQPQATATPTPAGTWETIIQGAIYAGRTNPTAPLSGAFVTYQVLHSHFPGLQEGRSNQAITDDSGHFTLPVMVHDTDAIKITVTAEGYQPYEERLVGLDLLAGKILQLELAPLELITTPPP